MLQFQLSQSSCYIQQYCLDLYKCVQKPKYTPRVVVFVPVKKLYMASCWFLLNSFKTSFTLIKKGQLFL